MAFSSKIGKIWCVDHHAHSKAQAPAPHTISLQIVYVSVYLCYYLLSEHLAFVHHSISHLQTVNFSSSNACLVHFHNMLFVLVLRWEKRETTMTKIKSVEWKLMTTTTTKAAVAITTTSILTTSNVCRLQSFRRSCQNMHQWHLILMSAQYDCVHASYRLRWMHSKCRCIYICILLETPNRITNERNNSLHMDANIRRNGHSAFLCNYCWPIWFQESIFDWFIVISPCECEMSRSFDLWF